MMLINPKFSTAMRSALLRLFMRSMSLEHSGSKSEQELSDPLLQPFQLKHLVLRNRIMSTSHAPNYVTEANVPGERYRKYHVEKARGGLALTMFGGTSTVSPDSPSAFGQINCSSDSVIPHLQELTDAVHGEGAATMVQLSHMGRRTCWDVADWLPVVAPSRVREPAHRSFPKEMDQHDIRRVAKDFGLAARRAMLAGLDGCELLACGHLLDAFWSPRTNRRRDRYGGLLENRVRFTVEVMEEVRHQVGPEFIVGMRVIGKAGPGMDQEEPGWKLPGAAQDDLTHDQCLEIVQILAKTGLLDFFNVNAGLIDTDNRLVSQIPSMYGPLAPQLHLAASFKQFGLPVFHACRINDLTTARMAVKEGLLDMVGMTRAHIADPHIVMKMKTGREEDIRPCVGAGYCLDRIYQGKDALCLHNAATGREYLRMPHHVRKAREAKKVVIVGGGPAGLEAARVSASRGHDVILFEAGRHLGGQIRLAQRATWRRDLGIIADWLVQQVERLGVDVRTEYLATKQDVLNEDPDVVIVATGGVPDNLEMDTAVSVWDVLSGEVGVGHKVLVYDDNGTHPGPSCAEYLATRGRDVELVTPDRAVAQDMGSLNWPVYLRNLYTLGVRITVDVRLKAAQQDGGGINVWLRNEYSGETEKREVDTLVVEHGTLPLDQLYQDLREYSCNDGVLDIHSLLDSVPQPRSGKANAFQLFVVGDAVSSRNIHAAIYDSLRICKDI